MKFDINDVSESIKDALELAYGKDLFIDFDGPNALMISDGYKGNISVRINITKMK